VRSKKTATILIAVLTICATISIGHANNDPFVDIKTDFWAYNDITQAYTDGVMTGTGYADDGGRIFSPSDKVTMAQFITILTRAFYSNEIDASQASGTWYAKNYDVAENHGLFTYVENTGGETEVVREEMAQIMYNVMADKNVEMPNYNDVIHIKNDIPDFDSVSSITGDAVATCYYLNLITGMDAEGSFVPRGNMSRAQTAAVYVRLKQAVGALNGNTTSQPGNPGSAATPGAGSTDSTGSTPSAGSKPSAGTGSSPVQTPSQSSEQPATTTATLTNGQAVTEENVLALMEEYKNGKEPGEKAKAHGFTSYVDCARYAPYEPKYYIEGLGNASECAKFAFAFWDDIFGDVPYREITNYEDVRPGDVIFSGGHWAIATKKAYWDANNSWIRTSGVSGGPEGEIGWANVDSNITNLVAAYTRYPE